ncbi:hypothetical protein Dshi_0489 [Dinoroseobacter shibae DFL 12 = DSM 16493]|jgi:hypothetical protein|uniref:TlpA family protein disulfide reductase n=1 Tax=Dinoroseobacter shibae (strain DSM 16493 / NCIMB 14021 / DFL 12) TaxID=398580 RepID=A8LNS9_DINSH|nr:hypothetical protein [Dinoroseobacter shibae]ABV92237.1 hypothetical protein Dshi_0489 [Dinoroseobacter shibae DFL 12 = DSM 16493]URF47188.1 hypothetical protein M8008_02500 [Dinoroseobacter shibae]URF51499.1 hypothetical protein M8007_02500 [Dinoroseobacter shibae]
MRVFVVISALCISIVTSSFDAQAFNKSRIKGTIFVRNAAGETIPIPWQDAEELRRIINFEGRHFDLDTRLYMVDLDHKKIEKVEEEFFDFSTMLLDDIYAPAKVYLKVFHEGYFLETPIYDFHRHDGDWPVGTLYIERRYFNDGERRQEVLDFLDSNSFTESEASDTLNVLGSLLADRADPEDFQLLVQMVSKLIRDNGRLPPDLVGDLQRLAATRMVGGRGFTRFAELETAAQFDVLFGLGFWLTRAPEPKQPVLPNLTYYQLAQQFFDATVELAFSHAAELDRFAVASAFQEYYKLECALGLPEDCFTVIGDFIALLEEFESQGMSFPNRRKKTFLADYRVKVEDLSEYGTGRDITDGAFVARMAANTEMRAYWQGFFDAARSGPMEPVVSASPGLSRTVRLAEDILNQPVVTN